MLKNYFKIAYRNLIKNKVFSVINILGLAIGMAACLLILQYVSFELSYDDFRRPDIYRVIQQNYMNGELVGQRAQTTPALAPALGNDIPEVIRSARLVHTGPLMSDPVMQVENRSFHEENIYYADSSFLTMFSYQMIAGDADEALTLPSSIVISESMANKYFPGQNAIDQLLTFHRGDRGSTLVKVTGIYADIPKNSHLHTDFLISFSSLPRNWNLDENWGWGNFYNYVEVVPGTNPNLIKDKITTVIENYQGEKLAAWRKAGYVRVAGIQPIQNIHLDSDLEAEVETNGSRRTVEFLTLIAFFILVIAWINYLNLTTAKSVERAKEIGIRKVVGSSRKQLISQILAESLVVTLLATTLAFTLSQLLMPAFRSFTQGSFTIAFNTELSVAILILFLIGSLLAGLYPAFVLSSCRPLSVLKGNTKNSKKGIVLRKGLVIFQFAASIALIAGTFIVQRQLDFMREQDLGLNMDQTLIVKGPGLKDSTYQQQLEYFRNEASKLPQLNEIAGHQTFLVRK
ncbi:MAG: ABC transporter permease [Cyclobacteriaceae bacterium]